MLGFRRITTEQFVDRLASALGPRLRSAVMYGSAVAGDFVPGFSDLNLLLVVEPLGLAELETIEAHARHWTGMKRRPPLVFTPKQLAASADAFVIEWLDLGQTRRVLHGTDPFVDFAAPPDALRLQLEHELHGLVLALRSGFLKSRGSSRRILRVLTASVTPMLVLMRAVLRFFPDPCDVPAVKSDSLRLLAARLNFDPMPFFTVDSLRKRPFPTIVTDVPTLFADYIRIVEHVLHAIDRVVSHPTPGAHAS